MAEQTKLGVTGYTAHLRAIAILQKCGDDPTPKNICQVVNYASSGIWRPDGTFNEERFNQLASKSINLANGIKVVTRSIFEQFLYEIHGNQYSGMLVWLNTFPFVPITFHQATKGSVDAFFDQFSDQVYEDEKAISIKKLREFYTKPAKAMSEIEAKHS